MIHRPGLEKPSYVYPVETWRMAERVFYRKMLGPTETFFSTANGYLGLRGEPEEGHPAVKPGTYVNGFHETWPIVYGEEAHGFARTGQTMVRVPEGKLIRLYVDDVPFDLEKADLPVYERALDLRSGTLDREIVWSTPCGKRVQIRSHRMVSFEHRHLAAIGYEVTLLDGDAPVVIASELVNPRPSNSSGNGNGDDPRRSSGRGIRALKPVARRSGEHGAVLCHTTRNSGLRVASGMEHVLETRCAHHVETRCEEDAARWMVSVEATAGEPIRLVKFLAYHHSSRASADELLDRTQRTLERAREHGFEPLLASQRSHLDAFWERSDVEVKENDRLQQALRFNLFHILQASVRADDVGIPAKGLTGDGYEGHYFWDTEIYLLPFLIYTAPRLASNLLRFRCRMLPYAQKRANQVNQKGALFPWRTINGEEASAYYAAGTAQYHINADIVYGLRKYVEATGDESILENEGLPVLVETARLWLDLGFTSERRGGKFCIAGVTGPDEYNTVVNNNTFTNLMARENLWYAADTLERLRKERPDWLEAWVEELDIQPEEVAAWRRAADEMYLPLDEKTGIPLQDEDFLDRRPWDFENTPPDKYPLLLHFHPLVIYRHQVIKQADVILAMFLLGNEFDAEEKRQAYDFYDPLTTGDSSLSACIQSIVACELGYREKAREYALRALLMDLGDVAGNVTDGLHMASAGGTWMVMVYGLAGFRDYGGRPSFQPRVPRSLGGERFKLRIRQATLGVDMDPDRVVYNLLEGEELEIEHAGETIRLTRDAPEAVRTPAIWVEEQ